VTTIPPAAVAVIAAALDDYRLTTPVGTQTPHGAAQHAAEELASSGWTVYAPRTEPAPRARAACPHCCIQPLVTRAGRLRRHGPPTHPCPGSGTPAA
jgi:hypothetical protein